MATWGRLTLPAGFFFFFDGRPTRIMRVIWEFSVAGPQKEIPIIFTSKFTLDRWRFAVVNNPTETGFESPAAPTNSRISARREILLKGKNI